MQWFTEDRFTEDHDEESGLRRLYLGTSPDPADGDDIRPGEPQAFLVRLPAPGELRVHWHPVDQFQYFVHGRARFGGHEVGPGHVHYSDSRTPYGPVILADEDLWFLTLRASGDRGAYFMPESQAALREARAADVTAEPHRNLSIELGEAPTGLLEAHDDGMQIEVADLDAGATLNIDPGPSGAYVVVVRGTVVAEEGPVGRSGVCLSYLDQPATVQAGAEDSRIAILRFPIPERHLLAASC